MATAPLIVGTLPLPSVLPGFFPSLAAMPLVSALPPGGLPAERDAFTLAPASKPISASSTTGVTIIPFEEARASLAHEAGSRYFSNLTNAPWALFTDMDGTLFTPKAPQSAEGADVWKRILQTLRKGGRQHPLVYVTGRTSLENILKTQREYGTAEPDVIAGAGGSAIYVKGESGCPWIELPQWTALLAREWPEPKPISRMLVGAFPPETGSTEEMLLRRRFVETLLAGPFAPVVHAILALPGGEIQKTKTQSDFRRCFYADVSLDETAMQRRLDATLRNEAPHLHIRVVVSKDRQHLLIDLLPASGTKRGAISFLAQALGLSQQQIFFSGDSGNDLDALLWSGMATLVNAGADGFAAHLRDNGHRLRAQEQMPIYLTPLPQIFGVEDGLRHFGLMHP